MALVSDYSDTQRYEFVGDTETQNQWGVSNRLFYINQIHERIDSFASTEFLPTSTSRRELARSIVDIPQISAMSSTLIAAVLVKIHAEGPNFRTATNNTFAKFSEIFKEAYFKRVYESLQSLTKAPSEKEAIAGLKVDMFRYYTAIMNYFIQ